MRVETRVLFRSAQRLKLSSHLRQLRYQHISSNSKPSTQQANPIGEYYAALLETPTPRIKSKPPTTASPRRQSLSPTPSSTSSDTHPGDSGPTILFSSRLSSPLERRSEIQRKSTLEAGIWVPPRPDEPDNCCMSGCVNCVWDRYRDEMEEWVAKRKEADHALRKEKSLEGARKKRRREESGMGGSTGGRLTPDEGEVNMDDDDGGRETLWGRGLDADLASEDLFKNIPVGIREFMKQEKRLKEKHARERTGT